MGRKNGQMKKNKSKKRGGGATVFPLKYFDSSVMEPSADAGHDLLKAIPPLGIRPKIGGKHTRKRVMKQKRGQRGGFVPSVMEGFVASASKYVVPLALFVGYKLFTKKAKKAKKSKKTKTVRK